MKKYKYIVLMTTAIVLTPMSSAFANGNSISHMPVLGRTSQPIGHARFCKQYPDECSVRSRNTQPVELTRKRWNDMVEINAQVNLAVKPVTDLEYYGVEEHWTYPENYGDCEDYLLLKRYMLIKRGWPATSLLITVVRQSNNEGHAVLTVRTKRGDYVLDNLEAKIKTWDKTPYRYLKRQSKKNSGRWVTVNDTRNQVASIRR